MDPPTSTTPPPRRTDALPETSQVQANDPAEESYLDAVTMEATRMPDESVSEDDVRRHFQDVESSFLPALSPIPTGPDTTNGGIDDTYVFDSPTKKDPPQPKTQEPEETSHAPVESSDAGDNTSNFERFDSSPTAAAAARTISRAVSMASTTVHQPIPEDEPLDESLQTPGSVDHEQPTLSRSQSLSERMDVSGGSLSLRPRRPKYLRSRGASQRSSTSSFATNAESHDGSDVTVGMGADYALQSGGAVPALGMQRSLSNTMTRSISMGSVASGFHGDDYYDPPPTQLETLTEIESPQRVRNGDHMRTPKPSKENLNTAPTDTVIARHVSNVQVPESLAKQYKFKSGLETPMRPTSYASATGTTGKNGRNLTLKEQSSTIERLSKENFDLKLKVMFLSDRLDKLSEEGIKEMISENVELKTSVAILTRDNKVLRKRVKELEKQRKDDDDRPSTARSGASSTDQTARLYDEEAQEREEELIYLRERVEEYAVEIERLRDESVNRESEKRKMADIVKSLGERTGETVGRQEEADVWKDLLEQETSRREQADEDNRKLREEVFRLKQDMAGGGGMHHTTNIYNITKKQRDRDNLSAGRPVSRHSADAEGSNANFSAVSTLAEEFRRESEQLRHENAELRREVGAQTSMLTSRNREKERLYQEIEDLKMAARRGGALSTVDSIFDRSASRAGVHERSRSRGSAITRRTSADDEEEREELENKLAEARDRISEVKLQNQELQRELENCMLDFETAINGKRDAEENALNLREELEGASNDLVALQAERDEALREQGDMENEFEALREEAQNEIDALEYEADQRNEDIQRLQDELNDRSENFEALQEEMRKMSEAVIRLEDEQDNKLRRIRELETELETSNKELEELESKLVEANDKIQRFEIQHESSQGEIAFLREEQEGDKVRIGDLEAALAAAEQSLRDEKDRAKEIDTRLHQEREQREIVANQEKEEVQQFVNELNREASTAKDEVRRLRKSLSSREVEATEWKERLMELENNLREALGDLSGTRSSLLKSIAKLQRELENTVRDLDSTRASVNEKDRIIKQRDELLESHALESRKLADLIEKERVAHRNTRSQYDSFQKNHQHLSQTASTQDNRIAELESIKSQDRRRISMLEQTGRDQLTERNQLLLILWQKLSALCGREWANNNALVDRQVVPSLEVVATRLPGFSKNLLAAVKAIEHIIGGFQNKIKSVERDLTREYQTLETNLDVRTKKLDRLETMVRNSIASGPMSREDKNSRLSKLEEYCRQLKVENATLRTAQDVRSRSSYGASDNYLSGDPGSPSPGIPRGPYDRDRNRTKSRTTTITRTNTTSSNLPIPTNASNMDLAVSDENLPANAATNTMTSATAASSSSSHNNDNKWLLRLRDMEYKLKAEREGRNMDRQAARQRLSGLETENKSLRQKQRRAEDGEMD